MRWAIVMAAAFLPIAARAEIAGPTEAGGAAPARDDALAVAQGHLRRAREHLAASCAMLRRCDRHAIDGYYVACEEAWDAVWTCPGAPEILGGGAAAYADALAGLLEAATRHGRIHDGGLWVGPPGRLVCVPLEPRALPVDADTVAAIAPQDQHDDRRVSRRHLRDGFGLPVVVRLAGRPPGATGGFAPARQSLAATAVLRFRPPGTETFAERFAGPASRNHAAAVLDLANPVEIAAVHIGPARPPLAADLTAPLLDMLAAKPRSGVQGFLQPFGRGDTSARLEMLEPHRPGRIPVVFIHGLASDEGTWFDMLNELRSWPVFHRCFEPWVFHYPTGAPFGLMAAVLRRDLATAIATLDPQGTDPALTRMVLVGHSMGGLHAKAQVVDPENALWDAVATVPFERMRLRPEVRERMARAYFFRPAPHVKRVVCIATPHRGAALASLGVGRLASIAVRQPAELRAVHAEVVRMNPGAMRPEYERAVPTTIDLLEPDSTLLHALEALRPACWVAVHSIVGDGHRSLSGARDDGIVTVTSAHTAGAQSEIAVPSSHTRIQHHPATIAEVRRILALHLAESGP